MKFTLSNIVGMCFRRRSSILRKCICLACALSIGWLTLFASSRLKLPDPGIGDQQSLGMSWRIKNIKEALNRDQANGDYPSRSYYDGSFIRGTRSEALEDLVRLETSDIVPGLGDGGIAVYNEVDAVKLEEVLKKEAFNLILSNKIAYTRKLPDLRNKQCQSLTFNTNLPTASVVIIFTNEAWSSLLRTVFSVLNRTPPHLLKEIILVDDNSTRESLGETLDYYIATRLPDIVRLVRLEKRSGLIQARLAGARHATGDVLVFLDAHCEATTMWLEPMLQRIQEVPNAAVIPLIDVIDDKTFEYKYSRSLEGIQVGGFTWSGHYKWFSPRSNRTLLTDPIRSPTMAGGLFAIGRKYFWDVGSYDSKMEVWGGENLEMSFRIWQCGGRLESIPCSRVGHIFRDFHPYSFPGGADTHGINTARLAEVWLDKYKELLYLHRHDLKEASIGDLTERKQLRENLNCKSFRWFLDNVYPEKFILNEDVEVSGRVFIVEGQKKYCIDTMQREKDTAPYLPGSYSCHPTISMSQYFSLTKNGVLRREDVCAEVVNISNNIGHVKMVDCQENKNQQWVRLSTGQMQHSSSQLCIDGLKFEVQNELVAKTCDYKIQTQIWIWDDQSPW